MGSINASYDQPSNSATITWGNATGGNGSYTYDVLRCTGTSCVPTITLSSDETSPFIDTISAISSGTEICYRVDVTDSSSPVQTDSSNNSCFTLPASLATPVITVSSDIRPTVSWSGISGATSYDVYRCQGNSCNPTTGTSTNVSASSYTESLDPVSSNQWCYAIKAKNASGTSDYSNQACGLKNQLPPPNLISVNFTSKNLVSSPSGLYDAYVTWTPVIGAITYELYHCSTGISSCVPNNRITPNDYFFTTFTAANLDSLTTNQHCFAVRAKQSDSNISALGSPVCLNAGSSF